MLIIEHSFYWIRSTLFFFFPKHWIASQLNRRSLAETIILQRFCSWPLGGKKNNQKKDSLERFTDSCYKAWFEEIVCNLLHSWKIAPEYSWFADNPSIVISIKTVGRLQIYWDNWNFKQALQVCKFSHDNDFKTENPICFKNDLHFKIKHAIRVSATILHYMLILNRRS